MSKNTFFRVTNESPQSERRQVLRDTLHGRALAEQDTITGRYGAEAKTRIVGSEPTTYPDLPPSSPWASDPLPIEPPLGFSVEDQAPAGEAFEVKKVWRSSAAAKV